jgi:hypothetical protein
MSNDTEPATVDEQRSEDLKRKKGKLENGVHNVSGTTRKESQDCRKRTSDEIKSIRLLSLIFTWIVIIIETQRSRRASQGGIRKRLTGFMTDPWRAWWKPPLRPRGWPQDMNSIRGGAHWSKHQMYSCEAALIEPCMNEGSSWIRIFLCWG